MPGQLHSIGHRAPGRGPGRRRRHLGRQLGVRPGRGERPVPGGQHRVTHRRTQRGVQLAPPGPVRAAAHLVLGAGADILAEEKHLAQAIADSAADPGLRAQALARRAVLL